MPGLGLARASREAPAQPAKPSRPPHSKPKSKLFLAFDPIPPHDALVSTRDIDRCCKYNWPASGLQSTFRPGAVRRWTTWPQVDSPWAALGKRHPAPRQHVRAYDAFCAVASCARHGAPIIWKRRGAPVRQHRSQVLASRSPSRLCIWRALATRWPNAPRGRYLTGDRHSAAIHSACTVFYGNQTRKTRIRMGPL
jgi:hypothetical protein